MRFPPFPKNLFLGLPAGYVATPADVSGPIVPVGHWACGTLLAAARIVKGYGRPGREAQASRGDVVHSIAEVREESSDDIPQDEDGNENNESDECQ